MRNALLHHAPTQTAIDYVYRSCYLQLTQLSDSVFYEDIADQVYNLPRTNFNTKKENKEDNNEGGSYEEEGDQYDTILTQIESKLKELKEFEPGIQEERMKIQISHDSIVKTFQRVYDTKLRIERKKREIYYHVQGRLSDCETSIVTATTRAGYPSHKGGQHSMRVELHERKVEIDRRALRREKKRVVFESKKSELLTVKKESDFIMEMVSIQSDAVSKCSCNSR